MQRFDVIVIGAGAAGMMCAATAGARGRRVLLLDHAVKLAEKIRISGGGRCNFTNSGARADCYLSENPHFCRSALSQYTPQDFLALLARHGVAWHEKKLGQLFCDDSSEQVIALLDAECRAGGVERRMGVEVGEVARGEDGFFTLATSEGGFAAESLVVATGGLSIPQIGATPFGYRLAEQFGLAVTPLAPALVPLTFHADDAERFAPLSGVSLDAEVSCGKASFRENLLFTQKGLSGPAILQISSYWQPGDALSIDLLPGVDVEALLEGNAGSAQRLANLLGEYWPKRFADAWLAQQQMDWKVSEVTGRRVQKFSDAVHHWRVLPNGTQGYRKAEVTRGGVSTRALSSKTMAAREVPGLYFVGEVVDVTGHLGGYNFQWAWSSGFVAGKNC